MHSDGNIMEIIPDMIEIGINVLDPVQYEALDQIELARRFRGYIAFHNGCSSAIVSHGRGDTVFEHARLVRRTLHSDQGGFIAGLTNILLQERPRNFIPWLKAMVA